MKRKNISTYFKSKNFYLSLLLGVCMIASVAAIGMYTVSNQAGNGTDDLNEPFDSAEQVQSDQTAEVNRVQTADNTPIGGSAIKNVNDSLLENDIVSEKEEQQLRAAMSSSVEKEKPDKEKESEKSKETAAVPKVALNFDVEKGLLWPVQGNVVVNYSMDKPVFFETLGQYKCNPAVIIGTDTGTKVLSSAKGRVANVVEDDETGLTVTMDIGNNYMVTYGQLKNCKLTVGDLVSEGDTIAEIAEPTVYYGKEGSNLYFEVTENGEPVNPLLLLR